MQISQYISELLFRYDCVVVPGFGAFLSERVSAKIDKSSGEFFPPCKHISFNTQLKSNDGLLANHISSVEEITYENAISKIKKQVDYAIKSLENSETIEFPNIGSLTNSKKGKITFEPTNKNNFLKDSFGLSTFISPAVTRKNKKLSNKPTIALKTKKQKQLIWICHFPGMGQMRPGVRWQRRQGCHLCPPAWSKPSPGLAQNLGFFKPHFCGTRRNIGFFKTQFVFCII